MRSLSDDMGNLTVLMANANNRSLHLDWVAVLVQLIGQRLPHLPGSALWVLKFVDEGFYLAGLVRQDCISNRGQQRKAFDTLCSPFRANRGAGHTPDLLGVGLEEDLVQATPKPVRNPFFKVFFFGRGHESGLN